METALKSANESQRLVLMKFTADWCGYCKKMEQTTFADTDVAGLVNDKFVPVLVDADKHQELVNHLKIRGLPALLIVSPDMMIVERITGFQTAERLLPQLNQVLAAHQPAAAATENVAQTTEPPVPNMARPVSRTNPLDAPQSDSAVDPSFAAGGFEADPFQVTTKPAPQPAAAAEFNPDDLFGQFEAESTQPATGRPEAPNPFAGTPAAPPTSADFFAEQPVAVAKPVAAVPQTPAFGGLCLASVIEERRLVPGDSAITTVYRGQLLQFQNEAQKQKFLKSPTRYWPMLDGHCPITLLQSGQQVAGELQHAAVFRQQVWLFSSSEAMQQFIQAPAAIVEQLPAK